MRDCFTNLISSIILNLLLLFTFKRIFYVKGKLSERKGRKAMSLRRLRYDCQVAIDFRCGYLPWHFFMEVINLTAVKSLHFHLVTRYC